MTARAEYNLDCNGPACEEEFPTFARSAVLARIEASNAGWLTAQPGGQDFCPRCRPGGAASVASADTTGADSIPLSDQAVFHLSPGCRCSWASVGGTVGITEQHPDCKIDHEAKDKIDG